MAKQKSPSPDLDRRNTGSPVSPENTVVFPQGGRSIQCSSNVRSFRELPESFARQEPLCSRGSSGGAQEPMH